MKINIYDFDKTIVPFDSGSLFAAYCFLHYPWCVVVLPILAVGAILMLLRIIDFSHFKKICFIFLPLIPAKRAVSKFWDRHEKQVHPWFLQRTGYTVVISASPDFLLGEIQRRLGFEKLICTVHNPRTGKIIGKNCRDEEKVRRLFCEFDRSDTTVEDVYSDSLRHDKPIFSLAQGKCYHIVGGKKILFDFNEVYNTKDGENH